MLMTALTLRQSKDVNAHALPDDHLKETKHSLLVSSAAAGVTIAGILAHAPLQIASLPMLVYLGIRPARRAYETWREERRVSVEMAETAALALFIVQGSYLAGSLAFSAYHLGRFVTENWPSEAQSYAAWQAPACVRLLTREREVLTQVTGLSAGDIIVVETGELIPVAGVVTAGMALVKCATPPAEADPAELGGPCGATTVTTGHRVEADTVVQIGRIYIAVAPC
jgi:cation transport ATPase